MSTSRPRRVFARTTVAIAAIAMPAVAAAQAGAATLSVGSACYVNTDPGAGAPITVTGSGFIPGDQIEIDGTGVFALTNADANGNISVTTQGPILDNIGPGTQTFTLTANDQTALVTNPVAQTSVTMANLAVSTNPPSAKPGAKVHWSFSGFRPGRFIYAHYIHRGHVVASARLGRAKGACGLLKVKAKLYPGGHPRFTSYKLQIDSSKR
ncbi:MAG: hypothetical protein ACYCXW_08610, partial [Solirubrobacteraceae bacterium]